MVDASGVLLPSTLSTASKFLPPSISPSLSCDSAPPSPSWEAEEEELEEEEDEEGDASSSPSVRQRSSSDLEVKHVRDLLFKASALINTVKKKTGAGRKQRRCRHQTHHDDEDDEDADQHVSCDDGATPPSPSSSISSIGYASSQEQHQCRRDASVKARDDVMNLNPMDASLAEGAYLGCSDCNGSKIGRRMTLRVRSGNTLLSSLIQVQESQASAAAAHIVQAESTPASASVQPKAPAAPAPATIMADAPASSLLAQQKHKKKRKVIRKDTNLAGVSGCVAGGASEVASENTQHEDFEDANNAKLIDFHSNNDDQEDSGDDGGDLFSPPVIRLRSCVAPPPRPSSPTPSSPPDSPPPPVQ